MERTRRAPGAWVATLLVALLAGPAAAELYRCERPNGTTTYTDSAANCPGARKHEPRVRIQTMPSAGVPAAPVRSPSRSAVLSESAERGHEARWRGLKQQKQAELEEAESRQAYVKSFVVHCNRGGDVIARDDAGIKHRVSCPSIHRELETLDSQIASLRAYLGGGLQEECRRAGCLPGWLR